MKISVVKVVLTEKDLMDIFQEFVKVDGLSIEKLKINDTIVINGFYKKIVKIGFEFRLILEGVRENILKFKIVEVKVLKAHVPNGAKDLAIKSIVKKLDKLGISQDGKILTLDLNKINAMIPYVSYDLISLRSFNGALEAEVDNLSYSLHKEEVPVVLEVEVEERTEGSVFEEHEKIKKAEGEYTGIRDNVKKRLPEKYGKILEYLFLIPDMIALLVRLLKDKRVDIKTKITVGIILGYILCPIDLLPDFIPFIGEIDDLVIALYGLNIIFNKIPENIILENWEGKDNIIVIVRTGVKYLNKFLGGENFGRLAKIFEGAVFQQKK